MDISHNYQVYNTDAIVWLKTLESNSIDCIITGPIPHD